MQKNILIVDDELMQLRLLEKLIGNLDYNVITMSNGKQVIDFFVHKKPFNNLKPSDISVMFLDLQMPEVDGLSVLKQIADVKQDLQITVLSATTNTSTIVNALHLGANDYIIKGEKDLLVRVSSSVSNSIERQNLKQQVSHLKFKNKHCVSFSHLVGTNKDFVLAIDAAKKASRSNVPVLITGDFGVGKEMMASAIHGSSTRAGKPFISIDCSYLRYSDLDENSADIILFGSEQSERCGIKEKSIGKIREAEGGTIFLDNVGCLKPNIQIKLLRFMQEGVVEPIGSKAVIRTNVRVISSTVKNLDNYVKCDRFRGDLYYCLNILPIYIPSLSERGNDDIKLLAEGFCHDYSVNENKKIKGFTDQTLELLYQFNWEGNIRQLKSYVYRAVTLCDGWVLKPENFAQIANNILEPGTKKKSLDFSKIPEKIDLFHSNNQCKSLEEIETEVIEKYLDLFGGNLSEVSKQLKVGRSTIYRKLK